MSNNFDMIATVSINIASPVSSGANFGNLLILGPGPTGTPKIPRAIPDVGVYGSLEEAQDVGFVTDGANADPVGVAARVAFSQSPKPTEVYIAIQKKAAGASGARQTILDANEAIKSMVGQQADMTGCEIVFNEDTRRIYITLTGPGTDMANTGLAEALAALQEKDYTVSVGGTKVTDLAGMKTLPAFTEISEMEEGGEDVNVVVTVEHEGALDVSYGMTVRYPEAGVLRAAAENENSDEGTPIDNPTETLELATATAARAVGKSGWYLLCTAGRQRDDRGLAGSQCAGRQDDADAGYRGHERSHTEPLHRPEQRVQQRVQRGHPRPEEGVQGYGQILQGRHQRDGPCAGLLPIRRWRKCRKPSNRCPSTG